MQLLRKIFFFILTLSFTHNTTFSQSDTLRFSNITQIDSQSTISVIAKYDGKSMIVRWGVNKPDVWFKQSFDGYLLERYEIDTINQLPIISTRDTVIVKAWLAAEFKASISHASKELLTVAQCLYGENNQSINPAQNFGSNSQELVNKYSLTMLMADINIRAATASGLTYHDKNVVQNKYYLYRISALKSSTVSPGVTIIKAKNIQIPIPVISHIEELEGKINLFWARESHEVHFSAYFIEQSENNKEFSRTSEVPYIGGESKEFPSESFSLSIAVENYKSKYYRLVGITPFGEYSTPSKSFIAMGRDKTPPPIPEITQLNMDGMNGKFIVKWKANNHPEIAGYNIYKANESSGEFVKCNKKIIPNTTNIYSETVINPCKQMYIRLSVLDTANNESYTLPQLIEFRDTIAPSSPENLSATIDSNGIIQLTWNKNKELDVAGYFIYRANSEKHLFNNIIEKPIIQTKFTDTISMQTLTEEVFYKVTAVDYYGHVSKFSKTLKVNRPDKIRPMPPSITNYDLQDSTLSISWKPSRSKDVTDHILYVKENKDTFKELRRLKNSDQIIISDLKLNSVYEYKILAKDDADLYSTDQAKIIVKRIDKTFVEPVIMTKLTLNEKDQLTLEWKSPKDKKHSFLIYVSQNDRPYELLERVFSKNSHSLHLQNKGLYKFSIKCVDNKGRRSEFSNILQIHN